MANDNLKIGPFFLSQNGPSSSLTIETGEVAVLFEGKAILHPKLAGTQGGAITAAAIGSNGAINWTNLTGPKHLFKPRRNGCTWDPKGAIRMNSERIEVAPIEVQIEQCIDAFWTKAWERMLGTGRNIRNIMATPEGAKFLQYIINRIFDSMTNSTVDLAWWGKNAYIDAATTAHDFAVEDSEWDDFTEQMDIVAGWNTIVATGAATIPHWNVAINAGDVSGGKYTGGVNGNITYYLDALLEASTPELQTLVESNPDQVAYYVAPSLFKALKDYYVATYSNLDFARVLDMNGVPNRNGLMYDGVEVWAMREWSAFDRIVGVNSHIMYLGAKGVFGVAHDIDQLDGTGAGLSVTTWDQQPHKGKTYIDSDLKMGMGILDKDLLSRAHITV
jgi:hypothetical protein